MTDNIPPTGQPDWPHPTGQQGWPQQPAGQQGWPQQPGYAPPPPRHNSGLAIASLVLGLVGLVASWFTFGIPSLLALIFGIIAIRQTGTGWGKRAGRGMAVAGTVLGAVVVGLAVWVSAVFVYAAGQAANEASKAADVAASTAPSPPPDSALPTADETTASPTEQTYQFGETAEWENGVKGTVVSVRRTSFGETATTPGPGLRVTFKVTNGSNSAIDLTLPTMNVRLGSQGTAAEQVFADNCGGAGEFGRLAPGRTISGVMCFAGRATTADVSFAPTLEYNALTWSGKVS